MTSALRKGVKLTSLKLQIHFAFRPGEKHGARGRVGQTGAGAAEGRLHHGPSPSSSKPGAAAGIGAFTARAAIFTARAFAKYPRSSLFLLPPTTKAVALRRGAWFSVSHHSLFTKMTIQEALCFARLFCPVGTLLLVGTLLMALNFCEKASGEQTLQARYALAAHRRWSRLLFSACPLASSCLASWVLRKVSPRTDFLVFSFYICFYQTPSFVFVTFRSCFRLHQYPARYLTCHLSADALLLS